MKNAHIIIIENLIDVGKGVRMNCQVCGKELEEFDEDYLLCNNDDCPSNKLGWNRLILKRII